MGSIKASILSVAVVLIFSSLTVQAKDQGKLTFFGYDQDSRVLDPGEVSVNPSGGISLRGQIAEADFFLFVPARSIGSLPGIQTIELNYNLDANYQGKYWGKWSLDFGEYGHFEGNFSGELVPFLDHTDGFAYKVMTIGRQGEIQGTFHGPDGDEEWLIKLISSVAETGTFDDGMDFFGEIFVK